MLGPDIGMHHRLCLVRGVGEDFLGLLGKRELSRRRDSLHEDAVSLDLSSHLLRLHVETGEDLLDDVLTLAQYSEQQVLRFDDLGSELGSLVAREKECPARLFVVLLKHRRFSLVSNRANE